MTFDIEREVKRATAERLIEPQDSLAVLVQDRAAELLVMDKDDDEWKWRRRLAIFNELYDRATKEIADARAEAQEWRGER